MDISEHRLTILFIENRLANICFDFGFHKSQLTFGFKIVFDFFICVTISVWSFVDCFVVRPQCVMLKSLLMKIRNFICHLNFVCKSIRIFIQIHSMLLIVLSQKASYTLIVFIIIHANSIQHQTKVIITFDESKRLKLHSNLTSQKVKN